LTHAELVERAGAWLRGKGCKIVFTELVTLQSETPDAIGWRDSGQTSFMLECKASRGDFHADKNKSFRRGDFPALGRYRYYFCPAGLIRPEDLPERWGLLWCHPKKVELVRGKDPVRYDSGMDWNHAVDHGGEARMLFSALNRLRIDMGDAAFRDRVHLPYVERQRERRAAESAPAAGAVQPQGALL
jgi:hypothetical protein